MPEPVCAVSVATYITAGGLLLQAYKFARDVYETSGSKYSLRSMFTRKRSEPAVPAAPVADAKQPDSSGDAS